MLAKHALNSLLKVLAPSFHAVSRGIFHANRLFLLPFKVIFNFVSVLKQKLKTKYST
jgi:hypothetical protein